MEIQPSVFPASIHLHPKQYAEVAERPKWVIISKKLIGIYSKVLQKKYAEHSKMK